MRSPRSRGRTSAFQEGGHGLCGLLGLVFDEEVAGVQTGAGHVNNTGNQFAMVLPRHYRQRSVISSFITGVGKDGQPYQVTDPGNNSVKRTFSEFKVRQTELWNLIYR